MDNSKIKWNGRVTPRGTATVDNRVSLIQWGGNSFTWNDVTLIEIVTSSTPNKRKKRQLDEFLQKEPSYKKKLIHLICRIKGEKVYDEKKEMKDIEVNLTDAELVVNEIFSKIKVENVDVL